MALECVKGLPVAGGIHRTDRDGAGGCFPVFVWVCKHLIDIATHHSDDRLQWFIVALIGCLLLQLVFSVTNMRLGTKVEIAFRNNLRHRLFNHVMESRWMGKEVLHTGDMLNRLVEDVPTITTAICRNIPSALATVVQLSGLWCFFPGWICVWRELSCSLCRWPCC